MGGTNEALSLSLYFFFSLSPFSTSPFFPGKNWQSHSSLPPLYLHSVPYAGKTRIVFFFFFFGEGKGKKYSSVVTRKKKKKEKNRGKIRQ